MTADNIFFILLGAGAVLWLKLKGAPSPKADTSKVDNEIRENNAQLKQEEENRKKIEDAPPSNLSPTDFINTRFPKE